MKCKKCGNETDFTMIKEIAQWDNEKHLWIEQTTGDSIICDECNGFDIEDEEWDFESDIPKRG